MTLEFDLPARWLSLLTEQFSDAIHDLQVTWPETQSLVISYRVIEAFNPEFASSIIDNPDGHLGAANRVLRDLLIEGGSKGLNPFIRLVNLPADRHRTVRQLRADDIGLMIGIEGIVTKISGVRPRIYRAVFACISCGHHLTIEQPNEQELIEPIECMLADGGCGRKKRETRFELVSKDSELINNQFIEVQELPEGLSGGVQPQRLLGIAEHDLAGILNHGDRVTVNGVLFVRSQRKGGKDTPIFDIFLRISSIERQNIPLEEIVISDEEERFIKELASNDDVYNILTRSIAPSIFGMTHVKESLMLQLFGGVARRNSDGTRTRGDIHILLMGDPGVAKSQLLSYMSTISPRGRFTSGMSATAAGLTAAAVQDTTADGRWTLEAGALALADLGLAAIDEFDKMNEGDRSSMHEAMEQQRISISKAGISATLRTRCAILAAANPKNGRFEAVSETPFTSQVNLGPPLLSRFDIIWLLTDAPNTEQDSMIANHIVDKRTVGISELLIEEGSASDPSRTSDTPNLSKDEYGDVQIEKDMIRKYIAYCKRNIHPNLDAAARTALVDFYVKTRREGGEFKDSIAITARALEALARLTEASARIRLSNDANLQDAEKAIRLTKLWRNDLMGGNFDETTMNSGKKGNTRNRERIILDIVERMCREMGGDVELNIVLNEAERNEISRTLAEDIIDGHVTAGRLFKPSYDSLNLA